MGTPLSAPLAAQSNTAELGRKMTAAALALSEVTDALGRVPLDAAASAAVMGLLERTPRTIAYGQLVVTRRAEAAEIHRLDPVLAQEIDELVARHEDLANGTATIPPGATAPRDGAAPQHPGLYAGAPAYFQ